MKNPPSSHGLGARARAWCGLLPALIVLPLLGGSAPQESKAYMCPPCGEACHQNDYPEPGNCGTCGMKLVPREEVPHVAVLLHPDVDLLSSTLPLSMLGFSKAAVVYTVADTTDPIRSEDTLEMLPQYSFEDAPMPDVLVVPGGYGAHEDALIVDWVRKAAAGADHVLGIGFGGILLAKTGLMDEVPVPLWPRMHAGLARRVPDVELTGDTLVREGKFVLVRDAATSLEACYDLVNELGGTAKVKRAIELSGFEWSDE